MRTEFYETSPQHLVLIHYTDMNLISINRLASIADYIHTILFIDVNLQEFKVQVHLITFTIRLKFFDPDCGNELARFIHEVYLKFI